MTENDADFLRRWAEVCLLEAQRNRFPSIDLEQLFRAHAHSVQDDTEHRTQNYQNLDSIRFQIFQYIPMGALSYCSQIAPSFAFGFQHLSGLLGPSSPNRIEGPWRAQMIQTSPSGFPDDLVNPLIPVPLEPELKYADRSDRSDRHWQTLTGAKWRTCGAIQKCDALCRVCAEFSG